MKRRVGSGTVDREPW